MELTKNVTAGKIFVTAFLDFKTYKKFAEELAWDTEVWIAEMPEHMIHLNGDKFVDMRYRNSCIVSTCKEDQISWLCF